MLKRNHELDITGGNIATGVLAFALPVIVTNVLQMLYNAADMIVVGRFCGDESLAAVGATGAVTNLVINLFIGFGAGVSALVSRYIGARDRERAHDAVHTSVALALVCGVVLAIFGVVFSRSMLHPPAFLSVHAARGRFSLLSYHRFCTCRNSNLCFSSVHGAAPPTAEKPEFPFLIVFDYFCSNH